MIDSSFFPGSNTAPSSQQYPDPGLPVLPSGARVTAETLRLFSIFRDLKAPQREKLLSQMQEVTVSTRTILLVAGQPGHAVYFLLEGSVKVGLARPAGLRTQTAFSIGKKEPKEPPAVSLSTGTQVMLNLCGPGAILGDLSILDGLGHSASVITRQPCRLLWMDKDAFVQVLREMPAVSMALLGECSARLRNATHQLHAYATLDAAGRIAHALLRLGDRFGTQTPEGWRLDIGLTQPEIADLTGLTRTRVNTVLARFKKNQWISQEEDGALVLHDAERLAAVARFQF